MKSLRRLVRSSLLFALAVGSDSFDGPADDGEDAVCQAGDAQCNALGEDDVCRAGDEQCALHLLQTRGRMTLEEGDMSEMHTSGRRRGNKIQTEDLSVDWERKLAKLIAEVGKNITSAEWKAYYMGLDLKSLNMSMFEVDNRTIGVNGTEVNWMAHSNWWMPFTPVTSGEPTTLSLLEQEDVESALAEEFPDENAGIAPRPKVLLGSPGLPEESSMATSEETLGADSDLSSRRRHGDPLAKVPPRTKRTQQYMTMTQGRIDRVWDAITGLTKTIDWMNNFMGSHHRLWHGKAVLLVDDVDLSSGDHPREMADSETNEAAQHERHRHKKKQPVQEDFGNMHYQWGRPPQDPILDQIEETKNQTAKLWDHFGVKARVIEALKRRVAIYRRAAMALMQERIQPVEFMDPAAVEQSQADWEEGSFVDINLLEEAVTLKTVEHAGEWRVDHETTEKCCKCASKAYGFSATGKCGFCKDVLAAVSVDAKCTRSSEGFPGTQACADMCVNKV